MQIKNNYEKEVFNGDIGRVVRVEGKAGKLCFGTESCIDMLNKRKVKGFKKIFQQMKLQNLNVQDYFLHMHIVLVNKTHLVE